MAALSDYYENWVIDHMIRGSAFTPPANVYIALFLSASTGLEANNPTSEVSTSGTAYARKVILFDAAVSGVTQNADALVWDISTSSWGTVQFFGIVDHPTNTNWGVDVNVLVHGEFTIPQAVAESNVFQIADEALTITAL